MRTEPRSAAFRLERMADRLVPEHGRGAGRKDDVHPPFHGPMRGDGPRGLRKGAREGVERRGPWSRRLERERTRRVHAPEDAARLEALDGPAGHDLPRRHDRARNENARDREREREPARVGKRPVKRGAELGRALLLVAGGGFGPRARLRHSAGLQERGSARAARGFAHGLPKRLGPVSVAGDEKRLAAAPEAHGGAALVGEGRREEPGLRRGPRDAPAPLAEGLAALAPAQQSRDDPDRVLGVLAKGLDDVAQREGL